MAGQAATTRIREWLETLAAGALDKWDGLAHPDIVMRVPFAPPPMGGVMEGMATCKAAVAQLWAAMQSFDFHDVEVFATTDPDLVFATARSVATTKWGKRYENAYVFKVQFRDGLVLDHTEFFNPLPVLAVFGEHLAPG